jgi:hypothetical protein
MFEPRLLRDKKHIHACKAGAKIFYCKYYFVAFKNMLAELFVAIALNMKCVDLHVSLSYLLILMLYDAII